MIYTFIHLPLRRQRHFNVSKQRKGEHPSLQRPVVLAIVTNGSKGRVPMRLTGSLKEILHKIGFIEIMRTM